MLLTSIKPCDLLSWRLYSGVSQMWIDMGKRGGGQKSLKMCEHPLRMAPCSENSYF